MRPRNAFVVLAVLAVLVVALALGLAVVQPARALSPPDEEETTIVEQVEVTETHASARVADPHDPNRAAHPVRVAAYALHPVGVALDRVLVRPAVWFVRREPFRTIFGYED